jgi:hypothetical protein
MEPETTSAKTICLTKGWTRVRTGQRRDNDVHDSGARSGVKSALSPRARLLAIKIFVCYCSGTAQAYHVDRHLLCEGASVKMPESAADLERMLSI